MTPRFPNLGKKRKSLEGRKKNNGCLWSRISELPSLYGTEKKEKKNPTTITIFPAAAAAVSIPLPPPTTTERAGVTCFPRFFCAVVVMELFISRHTHSLPFPSFSFFRTAPPWQPTAARAMAGRWEKEGLSLRFERDLSLPPFSPPSFLAGLVGWLKWGGGRRRRKAFPCCERSEIVAATLIPPYIQKNVSIETKMLAWEMDAPVHLGDGVEGKTNGFVCTQMQTGISSSPPSAVCCRRQGEGPFPAKLEGGGGEEKKIEDLH